jgi:hypothetical protein
MSTSSDEPITDLKQPLATVQSGGIFVNRPPVMRQPGVGYIKTIKRRGNTYMIRDSLPSEDDPSETNETDQMIRDLYVDAIELSSSASRRAGAFKFLYVLASFLIILGGAIVSIVSIGEDYIVSVIGCIIVAIQTLLTTFSIERRGVLLRDISHKLRKVSRHVRSLQTSDMKPRDKMKKLEEYYTEVDELDLHMFDNKITTSSITNGTNILAGASGKRGDSDLNSNSGSDNLFEDTKKQSSRNLFRPNKSGGSILPMTIHDISNNQQPAPVLSAMSKNNSV